MQTRFKILLFLAVLLPAGLARGAQITIYGLESVKLERVFDPDPRPQWLLLVSGVLKLTGGIPGGNVWHAITYVPQRTAAPRADYGIFTVSGTHIRFYSFITFSFYSGTLLQGGERIKIVKVNRYGQMQTETWFLSRKE